MQIILSFRYSDAILDLDEIGEKPPSFPFGTVDIRGFPDYL